MSKKSFCTKTKCLKNATVCVIVTTYIHGDLWIQTADRKNRRGRTGGVSMASEAEISARDAQEMIRRISAVGILGNVLLSGYKLAAGIIGHSGAMVSDAIHSLSDVFATLIAVVGVKMSQKKADKEHPYGHERMECLASMMLGNILGGTGVIIGYSALRIIVTGEYRTMQIPGRVALTAALLSIVLKEAMFWYTRHYAKKLKSDAFMADAWHHRSDALSSVGSLIGIGGARMGFFVLEPVASVGIAFCIMKVAYDILRDAVSKVLDTACPEETEREVRRLILETDGVCGLDKIRTRMFGNRIYIDAEIAVEGTLSLYDAHEIAENVHNLVEQRFPEIKHIMIHVNPV